MTDNPDRDPSRAVGRIAGYFLTAIFFFGFGVWSCIDDNRLYRWVVKVTLDAAEGIRQAQNIAIRPIYFLQPARKAGDGVTVNEVGDDGNLVLLTSFWNGQNGLRLVRRDGTVVAGWAVSHSAIFPTGEAFGDRPPQSDLNVDLHGSLIEPDGSVVFNFEYAGTVKLSRCGAVEWALAHATHHSLERSERGGYWIPGRRFIPQGSTDPDEQFEPFSRTEHEGPILDDLMLHVSEDGRILESKSVMRAFFDSGLSAMMTGTGESFRSDRPSRPELVHLNKIAELPAAYAAAFPMFEAGDLLISLRQHNMIAVIDPDTWKVKWHMTGPFLRQHDPEWRPDGTISLFNNNLYRTSLGAFDEFIPGTPEVSEVLSVNPATGATRVIYGNRPGQEFVSVIRGAIDPQPDGGYLVTEFEGGRAFQIDASGHTVWEYINRYDSDTVAEITGARIYPESYFTVQDWTCPAG